MKNSICAGDTTYFKIMELRIEENQYDFHFQQLSNYNRKQWPYLVQATEEEKIEFVRFEREPEYDAVMRLTIGNRPILICSEEDGIMIGISHWGPNDEDLEFDNNVLVNAKQ